MKRRSRLCDREALAAEIASLSKLGIDELRERWKAMLRKGAVPRYWPVLSDSGDRLPPPGTGFRRTQTLDPPPAGSGRRRDRDWSSSKKPQTRMAQSGTILIREWQGIAHRVTMLDDGVSFNGQALPFALGSRARDHRQSLVGAAVLRTAIAAKENNHGTR